MARLADRHQYSVCAGRARPATGGNGGGWQQSELHRLSLDAGRQANSARPWGGYGTYPRYRQKNGKVNTLGERRQDCFKFSLNGQAPQLDIAEMVALQTRAWWLRKSGPVGEGLAGAGYPKQNVKPPLPPDDGRGEKVYKSSSALCLGHNGQGQQVAERVAFPPLWGSKSFDRGASIGRLDNAAAFIKANMPFSRGNNPSDQDAWGVAMPLDAHAAAQPSLQGCRGGATCKSAQYGTTSLYGMPINGASAGFARRRPLDWRKAFQPHHLDPVLKHVGQWAPFSGAVAEIEVPSFCGLPTVRRLADTMA